jgi:preprotein translocase subunit YajC
MVTKNTILTLGFLVGLLGLLSLTGCVPTTDGEADGGGFNYTAVAMVVVLLGLLYFMIIRPQNSRRKLQQKLISELKSGDQVIAAGGIYGEVESISEESVVIKVESGAKIRVMKQGLMIKQPPH